MCIHKPLSRHHPLQENLSSILYIAKCYVKFVEEVSCAKCSKMYTRLRLQACMHGTTDALYRLHRQKQAADVLWRPASALNQFRYLHTTASGCKENVGDREEQDMPAAGIATSGPGTGTSNSKDAGKARGVHKSCKWLGQVSCDC